MDEGGIERPPRVRSHRDLEVWHKACDLAVLIFQATEAMPKSENYGLTG